MITQTKEMQASITPEGAKQLLIEGNNRFTNNLKNDIDLLQQVSETQGGQYPFATVLSCIDSRVSSELIFDQGVGDIFNARVAGNVISTDVLGSMEFACKLAGTKLIVVLGHTSCGAVKGACDGAELGNLTSLLKKIDPAVKAVKEPEEISKRTSANLDFVDRVAEKNVLLTIEAIRKNSAVLQEQESSNEIQIIGAMYNISNGKVSFLG